MTVLAAFAYTMIAYGPIVAMFSVTVARHPHEVIIMILGAFFWLLSLFLSSVIWISVPPLRDTPAFTLFFSVLLQEGFRIAFYLLLKKADRLLEIVSDDKTRLRKHKLAYVGGLGFGVISSVVAYANVIEAASGPGIVGILDRTEDSEFFVLTGAFGAQAMSILHVCWGVLLFSGLERWNWFFITLVPVSHLLVSGLSILNASHSPAYFITVAYVACIVLAALSMMTAGARLKTLKFFFKV